MAPSTNVTVERLRTRDNVHLAVHRLGDPEATPVLLVPGTFSNASFWLGTRGTGLARTLATRGFEAWVLDLRGHGESPRPAPGQRWNLDDWGRLDIPAAVAAIVRTGRRPLLVGHSAGGVAVLSALAGDAATGAAARAAVIAATPLPWLQRWRRAAAHAMRFAARHLDVFPARLLGLGPENELPAVMEQWMDWNIRGHWRGNDGTDYLEALADVKQPLLFLGGSGDRRFSPPAAVHGLFDVVGTPDKRLVVAGTEHGFSREYGHTDLIASRAAQQEIWPLIVDWLERRAASSGRDGAAAEHAARPERLSRDDPSA